MRAPIRAGIASWAVLALGTLSYPEIARAQLRGIFGQRGNANSSEMTPGVGGPRGNGGMQLPGPFPLMGGMERQGQGRRSQREFDAPNGLRRPFNNANQPPSISSGQPYQAADGKWYYPEGLPYTITPPRSAANAGQPYQAVDGNWYYPDGRPYTAAQPAVSAPQPYLAVDGKWYYPDGRPYTAAPAQSAANAGQPYQAVDGNWYYPTAAPTWRSSPPRRPRTPRRPPRARPSRSQARRLLTSSPTWNAP
jgi:hypothetical protein